MASNTLTKIDIFNHIFPKAFFDRMLETVSDKGKVKRWLNIPFLVDLDDRFRKMDEFGDYRQILSLSAPPIEALAGPKDAPALARLGNDGMAEYCRKYPDRFPGFMASLPLNDPEASLEELHRCMRDLGAIGIQIFSNVNGKPIDAPEYYPLFEAMAAYDRPIFLHPIRTSSMPDFAADKKSLYEIWWTFGWPYETSAAMARLVFSKLFDKLPNIKIVTHHMGGMIPYFEGRVGPGWDQLGTRTADEDYTVLLKSLKKRPIDYFRMFYADTALFGSASGTRCGLDFFGADKVVFASDAPFDPEGGPMYIRDTIRVVDELDISTEDRRKIYSGNAADLLGITV
ncbi:MAG TPA: amidohydrolase family protein [Alphaproteobacteria bacterium]|nr:amidohydrolase family protein [Alphaproteobacteria bacterium]